LFLLLVRVIYADLGMDALALSHTVPDHHTNQCHSRSFTEFK
jgi:hypothetical protein